MTRSLPPILAVLLCSLAACSSDTVVVDGQPQISRFGASAERIPSGGTVSLTAEFSGGSGSIDHGVGAVQSGVAVTTPALKSTTVFTLTVTGASGKSASQQVTVTVGAEEAQPVIARFVASAPSVTRGSTVSLSAEFSGGTGVVDHGVGAVQSGVAVLTPALETATTFTLTVTSPSGKTASQQLTVGVEGQQPIINRFAANPARVHSGGTVSLTAEFSGGTGVIDQGVGAVESGVAVTSAPIRAQTSFTLTVTSPEGQRAQRSLNVELEGAPTITRFVAEPTSVTKGGIVRLTAEFTGGTGAIDQGIGAVESGVAATSRVLETDTTFTLTVTSPGGLTSTRTVQVATVELPVITSFVASADPVTAGGDVSLTAEFSGGTGTIDQGVGAVQRGTPVTVVGVGSETTFTLTVTNALGTHATRSLVVHTVAAPAITSFVAAAPTVRSGQSTTLTPVFTGGTGVVDQGIGPVQSGVAIATPALTQSTTFKLTVTNAAGAEVQSEATVAVEGKPVITAFTAARDPISAGSPARLTATFSGGTGSIDQGVGAVTSGTPVTTPPLSADTEYTLTVTSPLGETTSRQLTVHTVALPSITSFTAAKTLITAGDPACFVAVFSGMAGSIDHGVGNVLSGGSFCSPPLSGDTLFTLTVTNSLGDAVTQSVSVQVVAAPAIHSFGAVPTAVTTGTSTVFTAWFVGGTGTIDQGIGAVQSGVPVTSAPINANTMFTLTVVNAAGMSVTAQTNVPVFAAPVIDSFTAEPAIITAGDSTVLRYTFRNGNGSIPGVVPSTSSGSQTVRPTATTTYELTVTNPTMTSVKASVVVTVVPPPSITSFTVMPTRASYQTPVNFRAVFSGYSAMVSPVNQVVASGNTYPTVLTETTTLTLRVYNEAGASVSRDILVPYDKAWQPARQVDTNGGMSPKLGVSSSAFYVSFLSGMLGSQSLYTTAAYLPLAWPAPTLIAGPVHQIDAYASGAVTTWIERGSTAARGTLKSNATTPVLASDVVNASLASSGNYSIAAWNQGVAQDGYVRRKSGIAAWSPATSFESQSGLISETDVAINSTGTAAVVWVSVEGDLWLSRSFSGTWTPPVLLDIDTVPVTRPQVGIDGAGNIQVAWLQRSGLQWRRMAVDGTLSAVTTLSSSTDAFSFAVSEAGHTIVASQTGTAMRYRCSSPTLGWGPANTAENWSAPSVAIDALGNSIVAWTQGKSLKAARLAPSCAVEGATVTSGTTVVQHPQMAIWQGIPVVVWTDSGPSGLGPYHVMSSPFL